VPAADGVELAAVDDLCRLALVARRLGCRVMLLDVDPGLRDLLVLAGVDAILLSDDGPNDPSNGDRDDRPRRPTAMTDRDDRRR
jgi:hypothetical protein